MSGFRSGFYSDYFHGLNWADPGVLWKKAPRAMRAMRGKTFETVPFQPYFGCTKSFLKVLSNRLKLVLSSNESYESKTGCNRTLATVLWVPLMNGADATPPAVTGQRVATPPIAALPPQRALSHPIPDPCNTYLGSWEEV